MKIFVSPPAKTAWCIKPGALGAAIVDRYSHAQAQIPRSTGPFRRALVWSLGATKGLLEGSLDLDCNSIVVDGWLEDCLEFALWFRTLVPAAQELVVFDESYAVDAPLTVDASLAELRGRFDAGLQGAPASVGEREAAVSVNTAGVVRDE